MSLASHRNDSRPTVVARFLDSVEKKPQAVALSFVDLRAPPRELSYEDLYRLACRARPGLEDRGLEPGDRVVLALPTSPETFGLYLAALASGIVPLFLPAVRPGRFEEDQRDRIREVVAAVDARAVLIPGDASRAIGGDLGARAVDANRLWPDRGDELPVHAKAHGIAHLQLTSGSTGSPKIAVLRHRQVSANVSAIGEAIEQRPGDRVVSWLPLYHDMGLICLSCVLYWQRPLVLADSASFVRHPINGWLKLISRFRGTISPAPTSAYQVCARLAPRVRPGDLDLSTWRVGFCGAEPVHRTTLETFEAAFAPHGLSPTTLLPVYGLAEATLAATIPPVGRPWEAERIDSRQLAAGRAEPSPAADGKSVAMVSVGGPLQGHDLRIVDPRGRELPERRIGEIVIQGPSVIESYWPEDGAGNEIADGVLKTGDLGYRERGRFFITGRKKEIIICRGRNLVPSQIEALVDRVLENGQVQRAAAFGLPNEETGSEDLHVVIEHRQGQPPDHLRKEEDIRAAVLQVFEVGGTWVHWVKKGRLPKTTSGKIMRYRCRELVEDGHGT